MSVAVSGDIVVAGNNANAICQSSPGAAFVFEKPVTDWADATQSATPVPACPTCPGDVNGDGFVDAGDIQYFAAYILSAGPCGCTDLDGDGEPADVDFAEDLPGFVSALLGATVSACAPNE